MEVNPFICVIKGCPQDCVTGDPLALCQKHFDEWELHDAEWEADKAARRLESVRSKRLKKFGTMNAKDVQDMLYGRE